MCIYMYIRYYTYAYNKTQAHVKVPQDPYMTRTNLKRLPD